MRCAKCGSDNGQGNLTLFFINKEAKEKRWTKQNGMQQLKRLHRTRH
jgi:hypothetical protein